MKVRKAIEEGRTIVDPLRESGVFPNMVTQMIGVGEATGAMDNMLQKIADELTDRRAIGADIRGAEFRFRLRFENRLHHAHRNRRLKGQ